jgi:2-polyprenyl-6-methoxyphenol hydroxylase-like FAD-dependent oxidoreductase/sugar lactone lactonase YvrE
MDDKQTVYDVAVVGYGPGGQALAGLLARQGLRVVALERYPALYNLPRAGHIDHEAVRIVQSIGDANALVDTLWEVRGDYVWLNGKGDVLMLQPEHDAGEAALSGWYSDFSQWQPNLERELDKGARAAGADVRLGWECVGLAQDAEGVEFRVARTVLRDGKLAATAEEETIRARFLVGADGAGSFVRRAVGIEQEDLQFNERWLVCDMETIRPLPFDPNIAQYCDPVRPRMLMPLGKTHRRFEWMVMPGESTEEMENPEISWRLLAEWNVTPETHRIARNVVYTFQARIARTWRDRRVFITGDAAHTMPPYAGQGLLSSLRDANNLAWKLGLVLRGAAPEAMLDSYERERRAHVRAWTEIALAEGRISCETDPVRAAARDARLLAGEMPPMPKPPRVEDGVVPGPASPFAHPLAGTLGLQAGIRTPQGEGLLDDLLGSSRFALLTIGGSAETHLSESRRAFLARLGAIVAELVGSEEMPGPGRIVDVDGRYKSYFGQHGISAVINRPDFIVFGAVRQFADLGGLVDTLAARLAGEREARPSPTFLAGGLRFAESPRWHSDRLWFSDVHDYRVKAVTLDGTITTVAEVPGRPAGLGFLPDGRLLVATALDPKLWTVDAAGKLTLVADLSHLATGLLNDMVVDGAGRAYVGDTGFNMAKGEKPRPGRTILWQEGRAPTVAAEGVFFPNGCAVTPDGRFLFLAETFARRITRFAIAGNGELQDRSVFAETDCPPDGLCLDEAGGLWIGLPEAGRFVRLNADGRLDRAIAPPFPFAVVPALGGPDGRTLFLCSADTDLPRLGRGETTARIDIVRVDERHAGWP